MHGMGSPGLFDHCANAEPRNEGPVGISTYNVRINYLFCSDNHLPAGIDALKINPHTTPSLSIAFSIRALAVNDADVRHNSSDCAQIGAAERILSYRNVRI